jgi:RecJ-like exonuclease
MKNIFQEGILNMQPSVPSGTTCDKLTTKGKPHEVAKCAACDGAGLVVVADLDERVIEECIMCLNTKEKTNGTK